MPRLSIIIPHRHNDERFESTLLSVLENRPDNCEIIAVHDGSYSNPYTLDDEVLFIERHATAVGLLNAGLSSACSPIVCVLLDGVRVDADFTRAPLKILQQDSSLAAVSVATCFDDTTVQFGIDSDALEDSSKLQAGKVEVRSCNSHAIAAGPLLHGGFYRKRALAALGGWNESVELELADIELAWMLEALALECEICGDCRITCGESAQRSLNNRSMKQLAELSVAFGVSSAGTGTAMTDLLRGCLTGNVSHAVAWSTGIVGARATDAIQARVSAAQQRIAELDQPAAEPLLRAA